MASKAHILPDGGVVIRFEMLTYLGRSAFESNHALPSDKIWAFEAIFRLFISYLLERISCFLLLPPFELRYFHRNRREIPHDAGALRLSNLNALPLRSMFHALC